MVSGGYGTRQGLLLVLDLGVRFWETDSVDNIGVLAVEVGVLDNPERMTAVEELRLWVTDHYEVCSIKGLICDLYDPFVVGQQ